MTASISDNIIAGSDKIVKGLAIAGGSCNARPYNFLLSYAHISPKALFGRHYTPENKYFLEIAKGAEYVKLRKNWKNYNNISNYKIKRSVIKEFTDESRRRLRDTFAKLDLRDQIKYYGNKGISITLTYPGEWVRDPKEWKRHLDNFGKWIRREYNQASLIWVLEFQRRGAPHYHCLVLGTDWIPYQDVNNTWSRIIGADIVRTETRAVRHDVKRYFAKYLTKDSNNTDDKYNGRYWGVIGRENLPIVMVLLQMQEGEFYKYRRILKNWLSKKLKGKKIMVSDSGIKVYLRDEVGIQLYFWVTGMGDVVEEEPDVLAELQEFKGEYSSSVETNNEVDPVQVAEEVIKNVWQY